MREPGNFPPLIRKTGVKRSALALACVLISGCHFTIDRTLPPGEISGRVTVASTPGASPQPVANARIRMENSSLQITADEHGDFAIVGLHAGTYALDISPPSSSPLARTVGLHVGGLTLAPLPGGQLNGFDLGTITMDRLGGISGTVTNAQQPVTGATAVLPGLGRATSTNGAFTFLNVLPGTYSLTVLDTISGGARVSPAQSVRVKPGVLAQVSPIDLSTSPVVTTGSIAGQAQLSGASSSSGVTITLQGLATSAQTNDDQGDYSQSNVPANVYALTATAPGFLATTLPAVIVAGPTTAVPLILLSPAPVVSADAGTTVAQQTNPYTLGAATFVSSSPNYQLSTVSGTAQQPEGSRNFEFIPGPIALTQTVPGGSP